MSSWQMVAISDAQIRIGVVVGGIVLVAIIARVRFCDDVTLPPKPDPPAIVVSRETQTELLSRSAASPAAYRDFLARDAATAGIATPSLEDMARTLPYRVEQGRHVLEVGGPERTLAGLRIAAVRVGPSIALDIRNTLASDVAYLVVSAPAPNIPGCTSAPPLPLNVMVLARAEAVTRVECVWRDDLAVVVSRVETIELSPLSAWYVGQLPPVMVGVDERVARGHRAVATRQPCTPMVGQAVRTGLERGQIGWRDLIDFYARHRCHNYQFPLGYRAFTSDNQRSLSALAGEP